jgi:hypothetical protein
MTGISHSTDAGSAASATNQEPSKKLRADCPRTNFALSAHDNQGWQVTRLRGNLFIKRMGFVRSVKLNVKCDVMALQTAITAAEGPERHAV